MPAPVSRNAGHPDGSRTETGEELLGAAKGAFRKCDPLGLIASGCPDGEYDAEAEALASEIGDPFDVDHVATSVKRLLEEAFGEPFGEEECRRIAEKLGHILARAGQGA